LVCIVNIASLCLVYCKQAVILLWYQQCDMMDAWCGCHGCLMFAALLVFAVVMVIIIAVITMTTTVTADWLVQYCML